MSSSASHPVKFAGFIDEEALGEDVKIFHTRKNRFKVNGERLNADELIPHLGEIHRKEPFGSIGYYLEDGTKVPEGSPVASNVKEFAKSNGIKFLENSYGSYFFWQ